MRYNMNPIIKAEYEKLSKDFEAFLRDKVNCDEDDISAALLDLALGWYQIGFDDGCKASSKLSPMLANVYGDGN